MNMGQVRQWLRDNAGIPDDVDVMGTLPEFPIHWARGNPEYSNKLLGLQVHHPDEPEGLCGDRGDHAPHIHHSPTLGSFWCTADQSQREPFRSEQLRKANR